jgi:hypothetical protein
LCSLVAVPLAWASPAAALTIVLSQFSSDETSADVLDATLDFSVAGDQLTLTVTNDTTAPAEYDITEIFFNGASNVTGLTLDSATHSAEGDVTDLWNLETNVGQGPFGTFDFHLVTDNSGGNATEDIEPGQTVTFVFTIAGTGPFSDADFAQLSTIPPGDQPVLAAAKFVHGPDDDSAFGGSVPEPATMSLLAAGLLGLAARRR